MLDVGRVELQQPTRPSVVLGEHRFEDKTVYKSSRQRTSFQMADLHLENYFRRGNGGDKVKERRRRMVSRRGNFSGCHDEETGE